MKLSTLTKKATLAMLTIGMAMVSPQAWATRTFLVPGTACQPVPANSGCIEYGQFGAQNNCGSTLTVECPVPVSYQSPLPSVIQFYYTAYDRSTTAHVACSLQMTDTGGNVTYNNPISTTGGGPGSGLQFVQVFPSVTLTGWWRIRCTIPAVQAGAVSHLTNILLSTNEP